MTIPEDSRLRTLLDRLGSVHLLMLGDFFLDHYLILDRALSEPSLETGLNAYQCVEIRNSPGAAGNVAANLRAFGSAVSALSVIGQDGHGFDLREALLRRGVRIDGLIESPLRFTPTYTKPMMREADGSEHELNRVDIQNRAPQPDEISTMVIELLSAMVHDVDGVLITDQVVGDECGVVTQKVREALACLAAAHPHKPFIVDSRDRDDRFQNISIKANLGEALKAARLTASGNDLMDARACAEALWRRNQRPMFITLGAKGIYAFDGQEHTFHPAVRLEGPLDICGAGDSVLAGIGAALCAGANVSEAAYIGNLAASITVQQIGTTGTASPEQIFQRHGEYQQQMRG